MESLQRLQQESLEYTTLLWSLTETPGAPNRYEDEAPTQLPRQLSIIEERQLADAFAFIASWKDDPDEIMAACVEERHILDMGIVIRIASNTGNPSEVVNKLEDVVAIMMKASHRSKCELSTVDDVAAYYQKAPDASRPGLQQEVLSQIIDMCVDRILSRLRSRHARRTRRTTHKPCLPPQLLGAVNRCAVFATSAKSKAATRQVVLQAEAFAKIFNLVETSSEGRSRNLRLMELLQCASQCDIAALSEVLLFDRSIDLTLRRHLPSAVSKLARYFEISKHLVDAARTRRHSLFHNIKVVPVRHPVFRPQHLIGPCRPLGDLLENAGWQKRKTTPATRLSESKYNSRLSDPRATWKVHAEIQILMFYEIEPQLCQPRIISSSKLACFCCDLFIRSYGTFRVPGTHGRIYNTWVLPDLSEHARSVSARVHVATQRFIAELRRISVSYAMQREKRRPQPAESALFTLQPWSSNSTLQEAPTPGLEVHGPATSHQELFAMRSAISLRSDETASLNNIAAAAGTTKNIEMASDDNITASNVGPFPNSKVLLFSIRPGVIIPTQAATFNLFFSAERSCREAIADQSSSHNTAFPIRVEVIGNNERKEALGQGYPEVDIDSLEVDHEYTVAVGAAALKKSIVLRDNKQQVFISFAPIDA